MNPYESGDWKAFVREVAARPGDALPRLVAADWIEERGDSARAEYIRVGCELMTKPGHNHGNHLANVRRVDCPLCELRFRDRELLAGNEHRWLAGLPLGLGHGQGLHAAQTPGQELYGIDYWLVKNHATWKRGFVAGVRIDWPRLAGHGDAILNREPVEVVTLTGERPDILWTTWRGRKVGVGLGSMSDAEVLARLAARWPADPDRPRIKFELPPEQGTGAIQSIIRHTIEEWTRMRSREVSETVLSAQRSARHRAELRERAEHDALLALSPDLGDRVEWLSEPEFPLVLPWNPLPFQYEIAHQCPAERRPTFAELAAENPNPVTWSTARYSTVGLTLRPYQLVRSGTVRYTHYFYFGRCAGCSTTILLEARPSPNPPGGTR